MSQALLRYQTDRNALNLREAGMSSQAEVNNFISSYFKGIPFVALFAANVSLTISFN